MEDNPHNTAASYFKTVIAIILVSCIGLLFVKKEVNIDETSLNIRILEAEIGVLQIKIAELKLKVEEMTAYQKIAPSAAKLGMMAPSAKPMIINISTTDLPVEFKRKYEPINPLLEKKDLSQ